MPVSRLPLAWRVTAPLTPAARLRSDVILRLLAELPSTRSFLEVGCGQGALAALLARSYDYLGYEPDEQSFRVARARLARYSTGSVVNAVVPAIPDRQFDVVAAFEVLEHQEDDRAALDAWVRWTRPGGWVMLSVPAHPERFGAADQRVGHFRRYTRERLQGLLADAGLVEGRILTYGFPLGYVLEGARNLVAKRLLRKRPDASAGGTDASGRWLQPGDRLAPLIWMGTLPFQILQRPFGASMLGTGFVVRARRPR